MDKSLVKKSEKEILALNSLHAEMLLDKVLLDFRKDQILKGIDQSLQNRNKEEFLRLTTELNNILKKSED